MNKQGKRNYALLEIGIKQSGSYEPKEAMGPCLEQFYMSEWFQIERFMRWVHENGKTFGSGNYEEVFREFRIADKNGTSVSAMATGAAKVVRSYSLGEEPVRCYDNLCNHLNYKGVDTIDGECGACGRPLPK